jgi:hypothetical protein
MVPVVHQSLIEARPEVAFAAASDPERQLEWDAGRMRSVQKLSPGPLGKGARYRASFKGMGKVEYDYEDYEPPRRFTHRSRLPIGTMRHTFVFEPSDGGTRMTQEGSFEPTFLGRLATPVVRRMLARTFPRIAESIQAHLRGGARTSS